MAFGNREMLASYHADYKRLPEELSDELKEQKKSNTKSYRQLLGDIPKTYEYDGTLASFPKSKLDEFAKHLVTVPEVERRLIMRQGLEPGPEKTSAFPLVAGIWYVLKKTATAEECTERFDALLKDDASDDLVGVILKKWLQEDRSPVRIVKAIVANANTVIETMRCLGYVLYGELSSAEDVDEQLCAIPEASDSKLRGIREWCLEQGGDYIRGTFATDFASADEDWLNVAAYCKAVVERYNNIDVLSQMIVGLGDAVPTVDPRLNKRNQNWANRRENIPQPVLEAWLGPMSWTEDIEGIGTVRFSLAEDVRLQFQIGNFHGSCLRLVHGMFHDMLLGLITDVNKRILVCRSDDGGLIGRRLIGISDSGVHVCPASPVCHPTVDRLLKEGTISVQNRLGLKMACAQSQETLCPTGITTSAYPYNWD